MIRQAGVKLLGVLLGVPDKDGRPAVRVVQDDVAVGITEIFQGGIGHRYSPSLSSAGGLTIVISSLYWSVVSWSFM